MKMSFLRKLLFLLMFSFSSLTWALTDVNLATQMESQGIKGIGPKIAEKVIAERDAQGKFATWEDFWQRVKGVGSKTAVRLSDNGLRLNGRPYKP